MIKTILKYSMMGLLGLIVLIALFGVLKYSDAKKIQSLKSSIEVKATPTEVWRVVSDAGNYYKVTGAGISHTAVLSGHKKGMIRECRSPNGDSWQETCTEWLPNKKFTFLVATDKEGYPLPFDHVEGTWVIDSLNPDLSRINMTLSYRFKNAFLGGYLIALGTKNAQHSTDSILIRWKNMLENNLTYNDLKK